MSKGAQRCFWGSSDILFLNLNADYMDKFNLWKISKLQFAYYFVSVLNVNKKEKEIIMFPFYWNFSGFSCLASVFNTRGVPPSYEDPPGPLRRLSAG